MRRRVLLACLVTLVGGCASSNGTASAPAAREPLREPYVVMSDRGTGVAVWRSGSAWLLLSTSDGFGKVADRTPPAVDTGGGLAVAADASHAAVAIGPVERLVRSPLVTADGRWRWAGAETPGAVAEARGSVSGATGATAVVLADGRVVATADAGRTWRTLTTGARLAGGPGFTPDAISWDGRSGVVTGHGAAGPAMAYSTTDGGRRWQPVTNTSGTAVAALPPCGADTDRTVPVIDGSGALRLVGAHGSAGAPVQVGPGEVTLGCAGATTLVVDTTGHVLASTDDGRHWSQRGTAPAGICDLAPTGGGGGFAVSDGSHPQLWRFTGDGAQFTAVPLPGWVARLGAQDGGGD